MEPPIELVWEFAPIEYEDQVLKTAEVTESELREVSDQECLVDRTIGDLLAVRLKKELVAEDGKKSLVIVEGFTPPEVYFAVHALSGEHIKLKITDRISKEYGEGCLIDEELFFGENDTLTNLRSGSGELEGAGAVFVMSSQGDRAGVANIMKLNDDNLLNSADDGETDTTLLFDSSWKVGKGGRSSRHYNNFSGIIIERLLEKKFWDKIPLRQCVDFLVHSVKRLRATEIPNDLEVKSALLSELPRIGMFENAAEAGEATPHLLGQVEKTASFQVAEEKRC